ncbi:MAG TPA: DUF423 domain-containing protein [Usitatibacteraceae bacterium]|nr:DUF423 domain-containing protein [Usitatibacteraceae bacterium]
MAGLSRSLIAAGAVALATGVALGAIGAHAAKSAAHPDAARLIQTAVFYQLVHGLGALIIGVLARGDGTSRLLALSGWLLLAGVVLFCGSLYALAFAALSLGPVAPVGGTAFMTGWALLAVWAVRG